MSAQSISAGALFSESALRLGVASLVGLVTGLEREWSGHATGPNARFAGIRTFLLLGMLGGSCGLLLSAGHAAVSGALIAGGVLLSVSAYVMAVRRPGSPLDGTTEMAAVLVLALGVLAGVGSVELAAASGAVAVLALSEKTTLQWFVHKVGGKELRAGLQFAVLALVILPWLPVGPYWGSAAVRPRAVWAIVLLFCGLNYVGYLARRIVGAERGYRMAGLLGGIVSSTAVTAAFSRQSRDEPDLSVALAHGVIGACIVLIPRVLVVSAVLDRGVAKALVPLLGPAAVLGAGMLALAWRRDPHDASRVAEEERSPLQLWTAIRMAVAFQFSLSVLALLRSAAGTAGVYATAGALGLTDVDALTVSMSRSAIDITAVVAARAIAIGILANTLLKLALAAVLGTARFRRAAAVGLGTLAVGSVLGFLLA